jgi:hypothetical protein
MLQRDCPPDSADYDARTGLMLAAAKGHREVRVGAGRLQAERFAGAHAPSWPPTVRRCCPAARLAPSAISPCGRPSLSSQGPRQAARRGGQPQLPGQPGGLRPPGGRQGGPRRHRAGQGGGAGLHGRRWALAEAAVRVANSPGPTPATHPNPHFGPCLCALTPRRCARAARCSTWARPTSRPSCATWCLTATRRCCRDTWCGSWSNPGQTHRSNPLAAARWHGMRKAVLLRAPRLHRTDRPLATLPRALSPRARPSPSLPPGRGRRPQRGGLRQAHGAAHRRDRGRPGDGAGARGG